jgi:two-component system nitrogen regulation response regulator NtrX
MSNILVVDDEAGIRELLQEILHDEGHQVRLAENAEEARAAFDRNCPELVLLDIWMPDTDGITLLKEWSSGGKLGMPVVMMSGHGTIDTAVEATKIGAFDFLEKPIALQKLLHTVNRALKHGSSRGRLPSGHAFLGRSAVIVELHGRLQQLSRHRGPFLFLGAHGSPFELAARLLHPMDAPWVAPDDLSWLANNPIDFLSQAEHGTLFLNEIGNLGKLEQRGLALLISRLDKANVRLVCCSSQPLSQRVSEHLLDPELFQALSNITLSLPKLRDYRDDIPELAKHILLQLIESKDAQTKDFNIAALNALRLYDWPFNWAQLQNVVRTLALTALTDEITAADVKRVLSQFEFDETPASSGAFSFDMPLREARDIFERLYFEHHLEKSAGNMSRIADVVGLERTHLYRKLKQLDIKFSRKSD